MGEQKAAHALVAVSDVDDLLALDGTEDLLDGERVGDDLARVVVVGQSIDHGHGRVLRQLEHVRVREEARHDDVVHRGEHAGDVLGRLVLADADLLAEAQGVAAKAEETGLERHARAGGRLHEDHRERLVSKWLVVVPRFALDDRLDLLGELEDLAELGAAQVIHVQKVALIRRERRVLLAHRSSSSAADSSSTGCRLQGTSRPR